MIIFTLIITSKKYEQKIREMMRSWSGKDKQEFQPSEETIQKLE
jgi:hypothetical protein